MDDMNNLPPDRQTLEYVKKMYHDMHWFFRIQKIRFWVKTIIGLGIALALIFSAVKAYQLVQSFLKSDFVENMEKFGASGSKLQDNLEEFQNLKESNNGAIEDLLKKYIGN